MSFMRLVGTPKFILLSPQHYFSKFPSRIYREKTKFLALNQLPLLSTYSSLKKRTIQIGSPFLCALYVTICTEPMNPAPIAGVSLFRIILNISKI